MEFIAASITDSPVNMTLLVEKHIFKAVFTWVQLPHCMDNEVVLAGEFYVSVILGIHETLSEKIKSIQQKLEQKSYSH